MPERNEKSDLEILARNYPWSQKIPSADSPAYNRLQDTLLRFANVIKAEGNNRIDSGRSFELRSSNSQANTRDILGDIARIEPQLKPSEDRRRSLHNELCIMIFGTAWDKTNPVQRQQITDLAMKMRELATPPDMSEYSA